MKNKETVSVNDFVLRQCKDSGKSYVIDLSFEEIAQHAKCQLESEIFKKGYRDGVVIVQIDQKLIHHFICPFVKITNEIKLNATLVRLSLIHI